MEPIIKAGKPMNLQKYNHDILQQQLRTELLKSTLNKGCQIH